MNIVVFERKEEKEVLNKALSELNILEDDCLYYFEHEKVGLLKKDVVKINIVKLEDVATYIKDFLSSLLENMGLDVDIETRIREKQISIKMFSNKNSILIGRGGQTLQALTTIVKQVVYNKIKNYPYIILDVENYKEKQEKYLERLAKNIARDVARSKVEVALENMNSYERRIIHNVLSNDKRVYTISEGEEPHRHVIIKPKED